jgi:hypothetical protein
MTAQKKGKKMQEQRQAHRNRTYLGALIGFDQQDLPIECVVRNLSPRGAMVQLDPVSAIPKNLYIKIPTNGKSYAAQMVWQQHERAGLMFLNA